MAARLEQDAKQRAEKEPAPVVEKTGLPSLDLLVILHEFRAPLSAIVGFATQMQEETFGPLGSAKYNDCCRNIKQCGEYLLGVIAAVTEQKLFEAESSLYKPAPVVRTAMLRPALPAILQELSAAEVEQDANLSPHMPSPVEVQGTALWDKAIESLGRSAGVLEDLAESTGEAIARIAARGDRIIQKETLALLNALAASETDAIQKILEGADILREIGKGKRQSLPSLRKIGEFLVNVLTLERSVDTLKDRTKSLEAEGQRLQRQVDEQAGELKVLVTFVHSSLRDQIEGRAERAAIRDFERLVSIQGDESRQSQIELSPAKKR
jgi:chaperonin cofactor prefoldin